MAEFRDGQGNLLTIRPTVGTLKRVRERTGRNLLDAIGFEAVEVGGEAQPIPKLLMELEGDSILVGEILYAACADQLSETEDEWLDGLTATELSAGYEALMEVLPLFFKRPEQQDFIRNLIELNGLAQATFWATESREQETSGSASPGDAQESSASIPADSPSANSS